jgi:luciferase family oxidoreductase group 1
VLELQGYLSGQSRIPGVDAIPGTGTNVPLYILGSSLFGARLAALLGLPYGFASHFAPGSLHDAVALYRKEFEPSEQLDRPHVIAGVNVIAADTDEEARDQLRAVRRRRISTFLPKSRTYTDEELDEILASPGGRHVAEMMRYTAVGTPDDVRRYLDDFTAEAEADELIVVPASPGVENRLRSVDLLADVSDLAPGDAGAEGTPVGATP